jgi:hypothetical protein
MEIQGVKQVRRNLDALDTELYNAVSNWNDFTENEDGGSILTEAEVGEYARNAFKMICADLSGEGLI